MLTHSHRLVRVKPQRAALPPNPSPKPGRGASENPGLLSYLAAIEAIRPLATPHILFSQAIASIQLFNACLTRWRHGLNQRRSLTAPNPIDTTHAPAFDEVQDGRSSWSRGSGGNRNAPSRPDHTSPDWTSYDPGRDRQHPLPKLSILGNPFFARLFARPISCLLLDSRNNYPNLLGSPAFVNTGRHLHRSDSSKMPLVREPQP